MTHIERSGIDLDLALQQWDGYVSALHAEGWETLEVPPADDCPDAVFVEDTVVVYGDLAVISRPGADERKPETPAVEDTLTELGYRIAFDTFADIFHLYKVYALPTQFFIAPDGKIIEVVNGPLSHQDAAARIEAWLPKD